MSDARSPAEPSSTGQKLRYRRILHAAAKLGSQQDFERVQMQDVAADSEVAIATLYRYFPSKVHLFVGIMKSQLDEVDPSRFVVRPGQDPAEFTAELLIEFTRLMAHNRQLSMSMMQAMILSESLDRLSSATIDEAFLEIVLGIVGWGPDATEDQRRRCWLLIQCWFGVLVTTLSENRPLDQAEVDIRRACELLLGSPDLGEQDPSR